MLSNLTTTQALPLAIRVSSQPTRLFKRLPIESQYLATGSRTVPPSNPIFVSNVFGYGLCLNTIGVDGLAKPTSLCNVLRMKNVARNYCSIGDRSFSSLKDGEGRRTGKLWSISKSSRSKVARVRSTKTNRSSWEDSAERLLNAGSRNSSREESAETFFVNKESRNRGMRNNRGNDDTDQVENFDDLRRDKFKNRFRGNEKPEFGRWNKQENSGSKATESSLPKMVGEGLYGVGPVLAALSSRRREFYALYVQEGLTLSSSNRKRKDKKGFEKVMKMAENMGLTIKEISKHDLNMVVGNRPHQGLVLDASPLEMVKIKELDPVPTEEDCPSLWVALDEVTDPQNLGAIIRSAYFFGASGVVMCAKNSAPLSGVVSKASAGSLELMELRYCNNMMHFLISSAENGWRVLGGSVSSKSIALHDIPAGPPTILVLGSEGTGLRPLVERSCTHLVKIPGNIPVNTTADADDTVSDAQSSSPQEQFRSFMAVESLNVSVAAGVLIHHLIGHRYNSCQIGNDSTEALD